MTRPLIVSPVWPLLAIILTLGYCAVSMLYAKQAESAYVAERANDPLYQENRYLRREWVKMYVTQQLMIQDQLNNPLPKAKRAF